MLSCLHILKTYLLTRRLIQAFFFLCLHCCEKPGSLFQPSSFLYESRLVMTLYQNCIVKMLIIFYKVSNPTSAIMFRLSYFFLLSMWFTLKQ